MNDFGFPPPSQIETSANSITTTTTTLANIDCTISSQENSTLGHDFYNNDDNFRHHLLNATHRTTTR